MLDSSGSLIRQTTVDGARELDLAPNVKTVRDAACRACEQGVPRTHVLSFQQDGALLTELFTHDGSGTLISSLDYEQARQATLDDIASVIELLNPLEETGVLVRRSRELLEQEISRFRVLERDGRVIACAALYPFDAEGCGELAALTTHPDYRGNGRGQRLIQLISEEARASGLARLFVLTTQTEHWFIEQGFSEADRNQLPEAKQQLYNLQRNSKVLKLELG